MNTNLFSFEGLRVFQNSRRLTTEIYNITASFPDHEIYGLTSQLRRAAISIVSNLAEGSGRVSMAEKIHFAEIAYGSLCETYCQLLVANDIGYIDNETIINLQTKYHEISNQIIALKHYFLNQKEEQNKQKNKKQ